MSVNWDEIREEWESTGITLIDLAEKHGVKEGTLKSRKSREKWEKVATKKDASKNKKMQSKKKVASSNPPKKRSGNPNPKVQFTKRNTAAVKHGFYAQHIPPDALEIFEAIDMMDTADMLWDQIKIMYTNIMRAQSIMHVESKDEMIKELKREKLQGGKNPSQETEWEFQFAWDRQAQLLNAQSRAISELRSLINQFIKIADEADERKLKLEQMGLNIEKTKAEIEKISNGDSEGPLEIRIIPKSKE